MRFLLFFLTLNTLSVYITDILLEGFEVQEGLAAYILIGFIVGALNGVVKPLIKILSLPFIFLTAGLFIIVINAFILLLAEQIVSFLNISAISLEIGPVSVYFIAALLIGFTNFVLQKLFR